MAAGGTRRRSAKPNAAEVACTGNAADSSEESLGHKRVAGAGKARLAQTGEPAGG